MVTVLFVLAYFAGPIPAEPDIAAAIRLYDRGQYLQASASLEAACAASTACAEGRLWLAKSYLKLRRWDDAIRVLESLVRQDPRSGRFHHWLGRAYGRKADHSSMLTAFGLAKKVVREFETALGLEPDNSDLRFDLLEYYLQAPGFVGGGRAKAVAQAKALGDLNKRLGYVARARICISDKQWKNAQAELTQAAREFSDQPEAFGDLAGYLLDRQDHRGAEEAAGKALALRASYAEARLIQAAARILQGKDLESAAADLRALSTGPLRDEDPGFEEVFYWLGRAYVAQGKKPEASQAFSVALQYDPDHAGAKRAISQLR
jgi:tetratricopeptide (TPR) repeat protein